MALACCVVNQLTGGQGNDILNIADGTPREQADGGLGIDTCRADPTDVRLNCEL